MGHVLGLGTLWTDNNLDGSGCSYKGGNTAVAREFERYSGCRDWDLKRLVEQTGGQGTSCSHWSEACLGDEMMTGYLSGATQPISVRTVSVCGMPAPLVALHHFSNKACSLTLFPFSPFVFTANYTRWS